MAGCKHVFMAGAFMALAACTARGEHSVTYADIKPHCQARAEAAIDAGVADVPRHMRDEMVAQKTADCLENHGFDVDRYDS